METNELELMVEAAMRLASHIFVADGYCRPVFLCKTAREDAIVVEMPEGYDKEVAHEVLRRVFAARGVTRYVFVSEAWTVTVNDPAGAEVERMAREGTAHRPDRKEVLIVKGESREGGTYTLGREIIRPADGPPQLGELVCYGTELSGRLTGLLGRPETGTVH